MGKLLFGLLVFGVAAFGADTAIWLSGTAQEKAALAQTLGSAKDERAVEALSKAALDSDPVVAYAAADALLMAVKRGNLDALANGVLRGAEARRAAGDAARARMLYETCLERGSAARKAAALSGLASLEPQPDAAVKPAVLTLLRDDSELVRLTGIHAAVREADDTALPLLFDMTFKPGEEGRAAALALSAMSAKGTDAFLYGEMAKAGPERVKAIGLLAARGRPELVQRLCDADLYAVAGVDAAAGDAVRACLRPGDLTTALAFTFGPLPAGQRGPLVSALASVVQQLPDQARVMRELGEQLAKADAPSRADVLGLLAGLQTEGARDLLMSQAKADEVELRKTVVRVFSKWNSPLAIAPLLTMAKQDPDRGVKILATRGLLALLQKPDMAATSEKLALLAEVAAAAERVEEKKAVYDLAKALGGEAAEALRRQLAAACGLSNVQERVVAAVNAGGGAVGVFKADEGFSGGSVFAVRLEADTADAADAAPEAVYQSCRFRDTTYTFDGLRAGQAYRLRLHFAETFHERAGARVFDVAANGQTVLADYDIVAKTGKRMKALTETVDVTADAAGKLAVAFKTKRDQALVNGLEVLETEAARPPMPVKKVEGERPREPTAQSGQIRVLLMTGANNHNWQETTGALRALFAEAPKFGVTVVENPWEMKPADIEGYDLILNNWNTYGKDKREWTAEMKAAFIPWVKRGGGFFVLHAGGSMFYDWEDFQSLTGGAWEKGTFHPHLQAFTVNIADPTHPVTRGLHNFETFDEPWQKIANRNPNRRVLATGVVSRANKGSGEAEPFAFVTELGEGRCFNLVLGHDVKALNNAGCKALILRGAEWAATGDVK